VREEAIGSFQHRAAEAEQHWISDFTGHADENAWRVAQQKEETGKLWEMVATGKGSTVDTHTVRVVLWIHIQ
jgi:hypothetical protein